VKSNPSAFENEMSTKALNSVSRVVACEDARKSYGTGTEGGGLRSNGYQTSTEDNTSCAGS
jgi:hypothetical protein